MTLYHLTIKARILSIFPGLRWAILSSTIGISNFRFPRSEPPQPDGPPGLQPVTQNGGQPFFQMSQVREDRGALLLALSIQVKGVDPQRAWNEIIKVIMVTHMDHFVRVGFEEMTNLLVKVRRLFHPTEIRSR
jgi:hypothetical protein